MAKSADYDRPKLTGGDYSKTGKKKRASQDGRDEFSTKVRGTQADLSDSRRRKSKGVVGKLDGVGSVARRRATVGAGPVSKDELARRKANKMASVRRKMGPKGPQGRK
jgi:hypothetical protein